MPTRGDGAVMWVSPHAAAPGARPPRWRFLMRVAGPARRVHVSQGGQVLLRGLPGGAAVPNRSWRVPSWWADRDDPAGGTVVVTVAGVAESGRRTGLRIPFRKE